MKILILEDSETLKAQLDAKFVQQGWEVKTASSYAQAVDLVKDNFFDVFVIDILLPDNKGYELTKVIADNSSQFIFISGLFSSNLVLQHIPREHKDRSHFIKKPFEIDNLIEKIKSFQKSTSQKDSGFQIFCELKNNHEQLKSYLSKNSIFDSQQLVSIVWLAQQSQFTGILEIGIDEEKTSFIEFVEGFIQKVVSPDKESYFGALLVEYDIALGEDIEALLQDKNSNKPIGEKLLEKGLLNPYMLDFILKEQIKIRLSDLMSYRSFQIKILKQQPEANTSNAVFEMKDLLEWTVNCLNSRIKDAFLEDFFIEHKDFMIHINPDIENFSLKGNEFLNGCKSFLTKLNFNTSLKQVMEGRFKTTYFKTLKFIYFSVLSKYIYLSNTEVKEQVNIEKILYRVDAILNNTNNLFQVLHLPWNADQKAVSKEYKSIIKILHTDSLPKQIDAKQKIRAQEALLKVQKAYDVLSNENLRANYLGQQEKDTLLKVLKNYRQATSFLKSKQYQKALEILESILAHDNQPKDTPLYIIWAKIKLLDDKFNIEVFGKIKKEIENISFDIKVSPLFWFVNGIYYQKINQYERAIQFFNKVIKIEKGFKEAFEEKLIAKQKLKIEQDAKKPTGIFSQVFKKSS